MAVSQNVEWDGMYTGLEVIHRHPCFPVRHLVRPPANRPYRYLIPTCFEHFLYATNSHVVITWSCGDHMIMHDHMIAADLSVEDCDIVRRPLAAQQDSPVVLIARCCDSAEMVTQSVLVCVH